MRNILNIIDDIDDVDDDDVSSAKPQLKST